MINKNKASKNWKNNIEENRSVDFERNELFSQKNM